MTNTFSKIIIISLLKHLIFKYIINNLTVTAHNYYHIIHLYKNIIDAIYNPQYHSSYAHTTDFIINITHSLTINKKTL